MAFLSRHLVVSTLAIITWGIPVHSELYSHSIPSSVGARSECPSVEDGKWATDACSRLICDDDFIPTTHGTCVGVADFTCQSLQHTGGGNKKTQSIIMDHYQENDNGILDEIEVERMKMVRLILNVNYSSTLKQASHAQREGLSQLILMDLSRATGTDAQVFTVCSLTSIDERKYRSVETMQHRSLPSVFLPSVPSVSSLFSFSFFSHSQDTPSTTQTHTRMSKETHVESAERRRSIRTQMQREDCVSNSAVAVYVAINHPRRERIFHDLRLQQRTPSRYIICTVYALYSMHFKSMPIHLLHVWCLMASCVQMWIFAHVLEHIHSCVNFLCVCLVC